jgi:hypothetical protein
MPSCRIVNEVLLRMANRQKERDSPRTLRRCPQLRHENRVPSSTSAIQICAMCLAQLEEPPRGRQDVQAVITLGSRTGVEGFECGDVAPSAQAHGIREEDAEGGETEATLAVPNRAQAKDAHAVQAVLREVTYLTQSECIEWLGM